jgi:hypothetical protein
MNYFNKALDTFSTNVVNPIYYVFFTTATIIASAILFQGFNTTDAVNTLSLLCGFSIIFMGVYLLNISRQPEPPKSQHQHTHSSLETGLMSEYRPLEMEGTKEEGTKESAPLQMEGTRGSMA